MVYATGVASADGVPVSTLVLIVAFTAASGVLSAVVAGTFMLLPEPRRHALLPHLVSFATGALLALYPRPLLAKTRL